MSAPERRHIPKDPREHFFSGLAQIIGTSRPEFSENALKLYSLVQTGRVAFEELGRDAENTVVWATDFRYAIDSKTRNGSGVVFVAPQRMLSLEPDVLEGDLVRTVSVAMQFPYGFCDPLYKVYSNGLDDQQSWMVGAPYDNYPLDPRIVPYDEIIRRLMGDRAYFNDFGLEDWNLALEHLRTTDGNRSVTMTEEDYDKLVNALKRSTSAFVRARAQTLYYGGPAVRFTEEMRRLEDARPISQRRFLSALHAAQESIEYQV